MLIKTQEELNGRLEALANEKYITVDTEFLREKTYFPKLCLVQVSGPDKDAFAIDPLEGDLDLKPLFELLLNENVLKIFHAARADMEIFYQIMDKKLPKPIFDTQIAAMVCGYGDAIGYESLVRNITENELDKSVQYTNWSHRPLTERQLNYALADVTHLVDIYLHLSNKLEENGRTHWVFEEEAVMTNPETYEVNPLESWKRIKIRSPKPKNLAALQALAAWREDEAQRRNQPRAWILRDETLADIASQLPTKVKALKKIRNIPGDIDKSELGETLIACIEKALNADQAHWPQVKKKKPLPPKAAAKLDILKMLLKIQAAKNDVAPKLVANSDDLEAFVLEKYDNCAILQGWRREIFGEEALALKNGDLAIGLKGSKIVKFKINEETEVLR
ncbi:MAG: ribonuclease D [Micavibrio sp. TMED27]|nr:ribonuclease D [Micavibrio sp.]OUT90357.1 MAG: ribonuclease D [Micavibrio sp. TMED27]|tara:strand:- start:3698 stop:4873 length:1176 start_codon:yes stop_codon:yes gene_type:complete